MDVVGVYIRVSILYWRNERRKKRPVAALNDATEHSNGKNHTNSMGHNINMSNSALPKV